jgi:hypothetical protein
VAVGVDQSATLRQEQARDDRHAEPRRPVSVC